ncbi:hypothetical protein ACVW16_000184 [Bradyrhizobium sp. USDA 4474]
MGLFTIVCVAEIEKPLLGSKDDEKCREALGPGRPMQIAYLRAAQAYMLISMPTGTSTIFGAFQATVNSLGLAAQSPQ